MSDFNILEPFELSLWQDRLEKVEPSNTGYRNIYKGLKTDYDDLSFWYFPRQWKEAFIETIDNNDDVIVTLGKETGATENIETNFSTTALNFKPNTEYTIIFRMDFKDSNFTGIWPDWNNYKAVEPNSDNFKMITLAKNQGGTDKKLKTIFDSDIIISFNDRGFNLNESNFSNNDSAFLLQYQNNNDTEVTPSSIYCICHLTTNDFFNEQNTIGLWTTLNCFKLGYWKSKVNIQIVEGSELYTEIISKYNDEKYIERLNEKNKTDNPSNQSRKGLFYGVEGKTNETILSVFRDTIRKEIFGGLTDTGEYNIPNDVYDNFYEEISGVYDQYKDIENFGTSTQFYIDVFNVFNKYFPFIPIYSTDSKEPMELIKKLNSNFTDFLSTNGTAENNNFIAIIKNNAQTKEELKEAIFAYINLIFNSSVNDGKITNTQGYEYLLLQIMVFFLNNNSTIKYIYDLIYKQINANVFQRSTILDPYTMNYINTSVYILILLLLTDIVNTNPLQLNNVFIDGVTQIDLNPLSIDGGKFVVNGNFNIRHRAVYTMLKIMYTGFARFGYLSYTGQDSTLLDYVGFLPWLNDADDTKEEVWPESSFTNSITFNDIIKLFGQHIKINEALSIETTISPFQETEYYLQDYKVFVFGSDTFYDESGAKDIQLKRSGKEISTLSFSLYDNYYDRYAKKYVHNPFIPYLKNESKLRLYYENEWYDFTIVNIQEDLVTSYKINYTAKDSNALELSKIGFNKTFNTELDNNIGNITDLAKKALDGLDWEVDEENTEFIQQWTDQPVFIGKTNIPLNVVKLNYNQDGISQSNELINQNTIICLFYNELLEEKKDLTILKPKNIYDTFEDIIQNNSTNNILDNVDYYKLDTNFEYEALPNNVNYKKPTFINDFQLLLTTRAKQLICKPKMHYNKALNRYVYEYKDTSEGANPEVYYGFEKTEYSTSSLITNLLPHGQDFINLDNWYVSNSSNSIKSSLDLGITNEGITTVSGTEDVEAEEELVNGDYSFLNFKTNINNYSGGIYNQPHGFFFNTDLTYNFDKLNSLKVNDEFVLRLQIERGIDKSINFSSSSAVYQDDQITMLEALVPCIYSYPSTEKVQSTGLSAVTKQDQLIYFWYPTQRQPQAGPVQNLISRAGDGSLIPIYWGPTEAGADDINQKTLPIFYTYEAIAQYWLKNTNLVTQSASDANEKTFKKKKIFLTVNGRKELLKFIIREMTGIETTASSFDCTNFPIVSSIFKLKNMQALFQITGTDIPQDINVNQVLIFQKKQEDDITYFSWWADGSESSGQIRPKIEDSESINYYIAFNLNNVNDYKACFAPSEGQEKNIEELEQYHYNSQSNCFEPINIVIDGLNQGTSTAPGLPLETEIYYNDFDIIMRARAIWKPVKYNPGGTCVFETVGKYNGKPKITPTTKYFDDINYNYGDLLSKNIGLFFLVEPTIYDGAGTSFTNSASKLAISKIELFRKYLDERGQVISPSDIINAITKTIYYLYNPLLPQNQTALKEEDMVWESKGYFLEDKYQKIIDENGEKINSITITESNEYNILQKLAEIFDAWLHINVKHNEDGSTVSSTQRKPIKKVYFTNADYKKIKYTGIKYGINLKNIQRQIDSNDIINKLIVKNNGNEYAELGFCSIMNSGLNISGSNSIFNFDYYVNNNILKASEIYDLLFNVIYPRTYIIGKTLVDILKDKNTQKIKYNQVKAEVDFYTVGCDNIEKEISRISEKFYETTHYDYSIYVADPNVSKTSHPLYVYAKNNQVTSYIQQLQYYTVLLTTYKNHLITSERKLEQLQQQISNYEQQTIGLIYQRDYLLDLFYKIYSSYIKEGSWISEDYIDDDLYYMDAEKKLSESCKPKVTYTIDIIDISNLPEFKDYKLGLRDKTYIEDTEIFGYNLDGTPYKEEIIVTELTNYLQSPDKNTITVQNYKTQFDDLFQRINSTIQAVEFGTGNYTNLNNSLLKNRILNNDI